MSELSRVEYARQAVQRLSDEEFAEHRSWCALDEEKRRERNQGAARQELATVQALRQASIASIPDESTEWSVPDGIRVAWIPGDVCTHEGRVWRQVGQWPTGQEPGQSEMWEDITPQEGDSHDQE